MPNSPQIPLAHIADLLEANETTRQALGPEYERGVRFVAEVLRAHTADDTAIPVLNELAQHAAAFSQMHHDLMAGSVVFSAGGLTDEERLACWARQVGRGVPDDPDEMAADYERVFGRLPARYVHDPVTHEDTILDDPPPGDEG